ncbi:MAG: sulfite exporter TauE/SafE family protein [Anaerolineae bacterium]|nr:sulfite exporter TauE/SafE family protein [Anaerolineae bacterium]MDQ7036865.1 sulfite exporter TauE/SafE family protein [Anaerolineae bacterium]
MTISVIVAVVFIFFLASLARSTLGFGDALISMPLLTFVIDVQVAAPIGQMVSLTIALFILASRWRNMDFRAARRLIIAAGVGIPIGIFVLKNAPEALVLFILGMVLTLYGLYSFFALQASTSKETVDGNKAQTDKLAYVFGFISGILGGAYNMSGSPIVVYGALRKWSPDTFRSTIQAFFLMTSSFTMLGHALGGLWTRPVFTLYLYSLPTVVLAVFLGGWCSQRIPTPFFTKLVYGFLILIGVFMMVRVF